MWNERQIAIFCRHFRQHWSTSWHAIAPPLREALVDQVVLQIIRAQERETVPVAAIDALCTEMHRQLLEEQS